MDAIFWLIIIIAGIVILFFALFFFGVFLNLLLLRLPPLLAVMVSIALGISAGGVVGAVIIVLGLLSAYVIYEKWEGSGLYIRMADKLSSIFNFK